MNSTFAEFQLICVSFLIIQSILLESVRSRFLDNLCIRCYKLAILRQYPFSLLALDRPRRIALAERNKHFYETVSF